MSSAGLNQEPVNPAPATLALREKARGGRPFCFLRVYNQHVVSNLPPPFFNFPFPLFRSNHCYQSGACFKKERSGRGKEREEGGGFLMEPSPAPGLISQRLHVCVWACESMSESRVSINTRPFNIPPKWCTADITLSVSLPLNGSSAQSLLLYFALSLLCAHWYHSRRWPLISKQFQLIARNISPPGSDFYPLKTTNGKTWRRRELAAGPLAFAEQARKALC